MSKKWLKLLLAGYIFGFLLIWGRLFLIQIILRNDYNGVKKKQYQAVIKITPYRGKIISADGSVLAESVPVFSLYADPYYYWKEYKDSTLEEIAKILHITHLKTKLLRYKKRRFIWIKRWMTPEETRKIRSFIQKLYSNWKEKKQPRRLLWFNLKQEFKRRYPSKYLAGQVIGFTGFKDGRDDGVGRSGVEMFYDQFLRGEEKEIVVTRDGSRERRILSSRILLPESLSGLDVYLTINASLQDVVEEYLREEVEEMGGKRGMAIVMDPYSGKILAMANYPFFDPNNRSSSNLKKAKNLCIQFGFEPGSVVKPFIVSGALNDNLIHLNDIFYAENGFFFYGGAPIHDHEKFKYLTVSRIIKVSSNIGMVKIADKLGREELYSILRKFGLGEKTRIDLPGEFPGKIRNWREWEKADLANAAFGQGYLVTLMQLVDAMAIIANGGIKVVPYVVSKVVDRKGEVVYRNEGEIAGRVIKEDVAEKMRKVLHSVTVKGGTGVLAALKRIPVAGKTGTAQKWENGGYSKDKYTASFVGFVPAYKPKWVIGVVVDEPQKEIYGGSVAAPVFKKIAKELLIRSGMYTWK